MPFWLYKIIRMHVTELILCWEQLIFHTSCSSLVDITWKLLEEHQLHIFFFCFMDCISLSHCMLISVVGYRPCIHTKCEKLIHCSLPPLFFNCPMLTIEMTQHTTTRFVLGHFTFPYNAKIKIIFQLQDTNARVCSIWNTACNSVHTEKWKTKTDPRYITIPKDAWQDTLHVHVHNGMYKLIVHFTQRTHYVKSSMGNSYLPDCGGYVFYVVLLRSVPPPSIASTCFFYLCLCNACASCSKSPSETHINI